MKRCSFVAIFVLIYVGYVSAENRYQRAADTLFDFRRLSEVSGNLSNEAKTELQKILNEASLTQAEIENKLERWAHKQGENIVKVYNEIKNQIPVTINSVAEKIRVSSLSDDAKTIARQVYDEYNNRALTVKEATERANNLLSKVSDDVRKEIENLLSSNTRNKRNSVEGIEFLINERLREIPEEDQLVYENIVLNKTLTKQQIKDNLLNWAKSQGGEIEDLLEDAYVAYENKINSYRELLSNDPTLSKEAKSALCKILSVVENPELTAKQDKRQRKAIFDEQTDHVREEMLVFWTKYGRF